MWDEIIPDDQVLLLPVNQLAWFWKTLNKAVMNVLKKKMVSSLIKIFPAQCNKKWMLLAPILVLQHYIFEVWKANSIFTAPRDVFPVHQPANQTSVKSFEIICMRWKFLLSFGLISYCITHVVEMMRVLGRSPCIVGAARRLLWTQIGRAHSLRSHSSEIVAAFHAQIF